MADLGKLSDAELDALIAQKSKPASTDLSKLSDDELDQMISAKVGPSNSEPKGVLETIGETYDKYAGAPVRAGFSELVRTTPEFGKDKPSFFGNLVGAGKAFANQFGEDPSKAPTGKEIAQKRFGLSDEYRPGNVSFSAAKAGFTDPGFGGIQQKDLEKPAATPADAAGLALDVGLDIGNVIPVGAAAKMAGTGAQKAGKFVLSTSKAAAEALPVVGPAAKGVGKAVKSAEQALSSFVNPKQAANFQELAEIAAKNNIPLENAPEAVEFGKNSFISRASRVQAEGPLGEKRLEDATKFFSDVTNAFDRKLAEVSKGEILGRTDAGVHLRESFDRALDNVFNEVGDTTYRQISNANPGLALDPGAAQKLESKLAEIEKFAAGRAGRGLSAEKAEQAQRLLNAVNAVRQTGGDFAKVVDTLQDLGEIAYKTKSSIAAIPPDIAKSRELYTSLRESIFDTIRTSVDGGPEIAKNLERSNQLLTDFFKNQDSIGEILGNPRLAPEQVFDRLTKNTKQIEALKNILSPEDFDKLKGAYMNGLVSRTPEGLISFGTLRNKLANKSNSEVVASMFDAGELAELAEIGKLAEAAGNSIMSTSGTGASNGFLGLVKDLPFRMANESLIESQKARARGLLLPDASGIYPPSGGGGGFNGPRSFRGPDGSAIDSATLRESATRIKGLPDSSPGGNPVVQSAATEYARRTGLKYEPVKEYVKVNEDRARRIAKAYEEMKHAPDDPKVKRAYDALTKETLDQYRFIKQLGLKIEAIKPGMPNPYPDGPKQVLEDIQKGHLWFFPTDSGFGSSPTKYPNNPLLKETDEYIDGIRLKNNDVFRIVHDVFGHGKVGAGFGPRGEENAWLNHLRMYSPEAQKALTTETRGQNSWVNYGPYGDQNRSYLTDTVFADQKVGLLPDWVLKEMDLPRSNGLFGFGPGAISGKEGIGLRLPQQISIQKRNQEKERGR